MPAFEVATIKPVNPQGGGHMGFSSSPGGRTTVGATTLMRLLYYAYGVQEFQVKGGPDWIRQDHYDIVALSATAPESNTDKNVPPDRGTPSEEQREMLGNLLSTRFGLKFHRETKEGPILVLTRSKKKLEMTAAKDKTVAPHGGVISWPDGTSDGSAFGINVSMQFFAGRLSSDLGQPVRDQTGLVGTYDFRLERDDPSNTDLKSAINDVLSRLGLKLKLGRGPVEYIVINDATKPSTEN